MSRSIRRRRMPPQKLRERLQRRFRDIMLDALGVQHPDPLARVHRAERVLAEVGRGRVLGQGHRVVMVHAAH